MNEEHIRKKSEDYWKKQDKDGAKATEYLSWYVDHLLKEELDFARALGEREGKPRVPQSPCHTLVLLVGYAIEPLLQSIYAYQPQCLIFIAGDTYHQLDNKGQRGTYDAQSGEAFIATYLQPCIDRMVSQGLLQKPQELPPKPISSLSPSNIFQALREALQKKTTDPTTDICAGKQDIVIDVTGGKKSMVTGAYLYAAFAQGVAISYVDFDDDVYDHKRGRPYGYRCRIGSLANPYQDFALRDWEQVRSLYRRYNFRAAQEVLVGRPGAHIDSPLKKATEEFLPHIGAPITSLEKALELYRLWDDGDYKTAYDMRDQTALAGNQMPTAVSLLGPDWSHFTNATYHPANHFFDDDERLRAYAHDELARIQRLIDHNEDYRSAFLKAGGLNEVLLVARFVRQCPAVDRSRLIAECRDGKTPNVTRLFEELSRDKGAHVCYPVGAKPNKALVCFNLEETMSAWWKNASINGQILFAEFTTFTEIRNKLIHTYASVTALYAAAALAFVQANFDDFCLKKPDTRTFQTDALSWSEMCRLCGLDQWLHPTLCADI